MDMSVPAAPWGASLVVGPTDGWLSVSAWVSAGVKMTSASTDRASARWMHIQNAHESNRSPSKSGNSATSNRFKNPIFNMEISKYPAGRPVRQTTTPVVRCARCCVAHVAPVAFSPPPTWLWPVLPDVLPDTAFCDISCAASPPVALPNAPLKKENTRRPSCGGRSGI